MMQAVEVYCCHTRHPGTNTPMPPTRPSRLRLAAFMAAASCGSVTTHAGEVTILAQWHDQRLHIIESRGLAAPLPSAGFYVEWANEQEFLRHRHFKEGATYRVTGSVVREEAGRFPEGWGARSHQPYATFYVQAETATRIEDEK